MITFIRWLCIVMWAFLGLYELVFKEKIDKLNYGLMWLCLMFELMGNLFE